jgi:RNA polymerase sigma factor (sigma-70 family)
LNHADVADVAQSTWLRLLDNVGHIRDPERLGGWLRTTSHNEAVTLAIRDNRRQRGETRCIDRTEERWNEHPETTVVAGEQRKELDAALHSLSPQRRQIVRLLADGASYVEVCERTGLPQGSIGPTWGRSIRRLRQTPEALRLLAERSNSLLADRSSSPLAERSGRADGSAA